MKLHAVIFLAGVFLTHSARGKPQSSQPLVARGSNVYGAGAGFNPGPFPVVVPREQPNPSVRRERLEQPLVQQPVQFKLVLPVPVIPAPAPAPVNVPRQVPGGGGISSAAPRQPVPQPLPLEEIDLRITDLTTGGRSPPIGSNDISSGPSTGFRSPRPQVVGSTGQGVPARRPSLDNVFDGLPPLASPNGGEIGVGAVNRYPETVVGFERNSAQSGGEEDAVPLSVASGYGGNTQPEESVVARGGDTYGAGQSVEVPRPVVSGDLDIRPEQPQTKEEVLSQAAGTNSLPPPPVPQQDDTDDSGEGHHMGGIEWLPESIPGQPLIDYPVLVRVPDSGFDCANQEYDGFFADTSEEARCQAFWVCHNKQQDGFLCPNGTIFNQRYFTCDWWFNVRCQESPDYYELNRNIGVVGTQIDTLPAGVVAAESKVHPVFTLLSEMLHYPRVPPVPPTNMMNQNPSSVSPTPKPAEDYISSVKIMEKVQERQASNVHPVGPKVSKLTRSNLPWSVGMLPQFNVKSHKRAANVRLADVGNRGRGVRSQRHQRHHKRSGRHKSRSAPESPAAPHNPSTSAKQSGQQSSQSATPEPYIETVQKIDLPMTASGSPKLVDDVTVMEKDGNITLSEAEKKIPLNSPASQVPAAQTTATGQTEPNKVGQPNPAPPSPGSPQVPQQQIETVQKIDLPIEPAPAQGQPLQAQGQSPLQGSAPGQLPQGQAILPPPVPPQGQPAQGQLPVQPPAVPPQQPWQPPLQPAGQPSELTPVQSPVQPQDQPPPPQGPAQSAAAPGSGQQTGTGNDGVTIDEDVKVQEGDSSAPVEKKLHFPPDSGTTQSPPPSPGNQNQEQASSGSNGSSGADQNGVSIDEDIKVDEGDPAHPVEEELQYPPGGKAVVTGESPNSAGGPTQSPAAPESGQQTGTGKTDEGVTIDEDVKVEEGDSSAPVEKKLHFPPDSGTTQSPPPSPGSQNQEQAGSGSNSSSGTDKNGVSIDEDIKVDEGDPAHPVEEELRYPPGGKAVVSGGSAHSSASAPGATASPNSTLNGPANLRDPSALQHDMPSENAPLDEMPKQKAPDPDADKKSQAGEKIQITSETVSKVVQNPKTEAIRDPSGLEPPKTDTPPNLTKKSSDRKRKSSRSKKIGKDFTRDLSAIDNKSNGKRFPEVRIIGNVQPLPKTSLHSEMSKTVNTVDETLRLQPKNFEQSHTYDAGTFYLSAPNKSNGTPLTSPNNPIGVNLKIFVDQKPINASNQSGIGSVTVGQAPTSVKHRRMIQADILSVADAYDYDYAELPSWMHRVAAVKRSVVSPFSSAELSLHDQADQGRTAEASQNLAPLHEASRPVRKAIHVPHPQSSDVKRALAAPRVNKIFQQARAELMKLFGGPQETLDSEIDSLLGKRQSDKDKRENDMKLRLDSSSLTSYPEQGLDPL